MIEQDMVGKGAVYSITAPILSAALEGLSKVTGEKGPQAQEMARYNTHLTPHIHNLTFDPL
jgi:hypothetical protein